MTVHIAGELDNWPTQNEMVSILVVSGLRVHRGQYSIRILDCTHFVFQQYGGDLGVPRLEADAETLRDMIRDARLVSEALAKGGIRHRFELYDDSDQLCGYFHNAWPMPVIAGSS